VDDRFVVIVTSTVMSGTVVRWYDNLTAAEYAADHPWVSASRAGVLVSGFIHEVPAQILDAANKAFGALRTPGGSRKAVEALATHRSLFGGSLVPIRAGEPS